MTSTGPRSFGKYLLEREIARGGMARVHLATLRGLGGFEKRLVVKEILPELASDPKFVAMFVEEAKVLVALSHPNIVPVYELGIMDGTYFLAMEHVEGATLADLVAERALTAAEAARVGAEVADALAYAHERFDIVHRDVSPNNVMVDTAGHARLLDFGIAARADLGDGDALYGTPGFLSPEQARGEKLGPASDLFSLGCVLAYAVQGASPIGSRDLERLRALDAVPEIAIDDAPSLARIVRELLGPVPNQRPSSARAVARSLASAAAALERDEESSIATLAARASRSHGARAEGPVPSAPETGPVTPGRVETLAKSQALDAILATGKVTREGPTSKEIGESDASAPRTARIERPRPASAESAPANRGPAIVLSVLAAAVAALLMWNARFELGPTPRIDAVDHGLRSPADILPLPIDDASESALDGAIEDAGVADGAASGADGGEAPVTPRARDAGGRGTATLTVQVNPWANVFLDGHLIASGAREMTVRGVQIGPHALRLDCPALGRRADASFRAEAGASLLITADLERDPVVIRGP